MKNIRYCYEDKKTTMSFGKKLHRKSSEIKTCSFNECRASVKLVLPPLLRNKAILSKSHLKRSNLHQLSVELFLKFLQPKDIREYFQKLGFLRLV